MNARTPPLTDFLLERIAEDEERAQASASPVRAVAECEAKRRILSIHGAATSVRDWDAAGDEVVTLHCEACSECCSTNFDVDTWPCETLRAMASVYADDAAFDGAWVSW